MAQFSEKVALVTGSASGIGQTTAQFYAREGARGVVSDVDVEGGNQVVVFSDLTYYLRNS